MEVADTRLPDDDLGPLLARGRDAEVFALGADRVVRRMPDPRDLTVESEVMEHVRAAGFPVPRVWRVAPGEMVMDRIAGPTMLDDLGQHPWRVGRHARTLADLHRRLHAIDAPEGLREHPLAGPSVLHLDLHPGNVILAPSGPVVIDWTNTRRGAGGADAALTWILMAAFEREPAESPGLVPRLVGRAEGLIRRRLVRAFLDAVGRDEARRALPAAAEHRLADRSVRPAEATAIRALVAAEAR